MGGIPYRRLGLFVYEGGTESEVGAEFDGIDLVLSTRAVPQPDGVPYVEEALVFPTDRESLDALIVFATEVRERITPR